MSRFLTTGRYLNNTPHRLEEEEEEEEEEERKKEQA